MAKKTEKSKHQSREARRATKTDRVLEEGLAAVREGREPHINGDTPHLGTIKVIDPHELHSKTLRTKIVYLRDDPVGQMYKLGQLGSGNDADVRLKSARDWQTIYQLAEIGRAKAIDLTKDVVDGGRFGMADSQVVTQAQADINRIMRHLGLVVMMTTYGTEVRLLRSALLTWVLGEGLFLYDDSGLRTETVASRLGFDRRRLRVVPHFVDSLDLLAIALGISTDERRRHGPRRRPDGHDIAARLAHSPELHRAVRLAADSE
jgi:hypothetical protein